MTTIAPGIWCDPCLAPLIRALNGAEGLEREWSPRFGVWRTTLASCCGHGRYPGWIMMAGDRVLVLTDRESANAFYEKGERP